MINIGDKVQINSNLDEIKKHNGKFGIVTNIQDAEVLLNSEEVLPRYKIDLGDECFVLCWRDELVTN